MHILWSHLAVWNLFLVPEQTWPSTCQRNTIFAIKIMGECKCVSVCAWRRAVIRWPYFISAWSPFGMCPTHSAILHDSIATPAFYLALLHQPYFSFLIYCRLENNLNDGVIFPAWRLVWIRERMERITREGKVITASLLDYWFSSSRTQLEIREHCELKVLQWCIFIELWTSCTFVIFTVPWDK